MTHPDSELLAEFRTGLITGRRGARISAHLAACDRCTGVCDQLAEVSALLAAVAVPAMPDAVAQRLQSVLAAEAIQRDSSERAVDPRTPDRASPPPRRHRDFRLVALRVLAPAAAVVLLAAGGYGLSRIGGGSTSSVTAGSEAAPAASSAHSGAAAVPSSAARSLRGAAPAIEAPVTSGVVTSATDYHRATLQRQLEDEPQLHARTAGSARELGSLEGCVQRVTAGTRPGTLLLVEKARFQGQPAIVIVARSGLDDIAWVIASGCSASSDHVLATATLPGTSAP